MGSARSRSWNSSKTTRVRTPLRSLAERLGVQHSKVQRALGRLEEAGLYDARRRGVVPRAAEEFVIYALPYLHPAREGPIVRGVPIAWAALPLAGEIASDDLPPVWPQPRGTVRGQAVLGFKTSRTPSG